MVGREGEGVLGCVIGRALDRALGIRGVREQGDGLAFRVVAAIREFPDDSNGGIERHETEIDVNGQKGSGPVDGDDRVETGGPGTQKLQTQRDQGWSNAARR